MCLRPKLLVDRLHTYIILHTYTKTRTYGTCVPIHAQREREKARDFCARAFIWNMNESAGAWHAKTNAHWNSRVKLCYHGILMHATSHAKREHYGPHKISSAPAAKSKEEQGQNDDQRRAIAQPSWETTKGGQTWSERAGNPSLYVGCGRSNT